MSSTVVERSERSDVRGWFGRVGDTVRGWVAQSRSFFTEVQQELKRVTWPTQKEVYATTVVVILTSIFFGFYLYAIDLGLSRVIDWILFKFGAR